MATFLHLDQRTDDWFKWRHKGIGSSESSTLMGLNKYTSVEKLWRLKTNRENKDQTYSYLASRGTFLEPKARKAYTEFTGIEVMDILCHHDKFHFIKASLDGWNMEHQLILEIKCPKQVNHYRAVAESWIKPEYYCQIQHQYLASGGKKADYWSFDGMSGHRLSVEPDPYFMGELLEREILFWECVEQDKEPNPEWFKELT